MNRDFFASLDARTAAFNQREGAESSEVEVVLGTGRVYRLRRIVDLTDDWFHADVVEITDLDRVISLAVPYWQIHQVTFVQPKQKLRHAGFVSG